MWLRTWKTPPFVDSRALHRKLNLRWQRKDMLKSDWRLEVKSTWSLHIFLTNTKKPPLERGFPESRFRYWRYMFDISFWAAPTQLHPSMENTSTFFPGGLLHTYTHPLRLGPLSHSLTIGRNETTPSHFTLIFTAPYPNFYLQLRWQNVTYLVDSTMLNCILILRSSKRMRQKVTEDWKLVWHGVNICNLKSS